jgi:hypothetical protein
MKTITVTIAMLMAVTETRRALMNYSPPLGKGYSGDSTPAQMLSKIAW